MSTTLICAPTGVDPGLLLDALAREAKDVSVALQAISARAYAPRNEATTSTSEALRQLVECEPGQSIVGFDPAMDVLVGLLPRDATPLPRLLLVLGSPHSLAASAKKSTRRSPALAVANYERSLRALLTGLAGLDVVIAAEEDDAATVLGWLQGLDDTEALSTVEQSERDGARTDWLPPEVATLFGVASELRGPHRHFQAPALGDASPWGEELLGLSSDLDHVTSALLFTSEQLAAVMEVEPAGRLGSFQHNSAGDDGDQFQEPDEGEPYRLNASEDRHAYHLWLTRHREPTVVGGVNDPPVRSAATRPTRDVPLISVIVPVWRTPRWVLERCVGSVLAQTTSDWELAICDDASGDEELAAYLRGLPRLDRRIKVVTAPVNGGISKARNLAIAASRGRFLAFLDHDDELAPGALAAMAEAIRTSDDVDVVYSDEDKIDATGERYDPLFKPEWSPDLLLSFAYICHLTAIRRSLVEELGGFRSEFDGSEDWDLTLRATERARGIVHVPRVLYHWRNLPGSAASDTQRNQAKPWAYEAGRRAVEDALVRRGEPGEVTMLEEFPGRYHVRRTVADEPLVSVIIPFRDQPEMLATCARTLRVAPGYSNFELVLVDNGSELPETAALLDELAKEPGVRIVQAPGPFNWAAINNAAARASSGELFLFMNNDIEARRPDWLGAMVGHALRREVGAVGARLIYPDGTIQHAGVALGLGGIAGHVLRGLPGHVPGYNSMAIQTRNCSVVTGAAMMVRRDVFFEVDGFDEELAVAFNDVDFCLKLRERGYLIVFTPLAELIHYESKSRGHTDDFAESKRILSRWAPVLVAGDPYMNVHLSHWRYWCPLSTAQEDFRWRNYLEMRVLTPDSSSSE